MKKRRKKTWTDWELEEKQWEWNVMDSCQKPLLFLFFLYFRKRKYGWKDNIRNMESRGKQGWIVNNHMGKLFDRVWGGNERARFNVAHLYEVVSLVFFWGGWKWSVVYSLPPTPSSSFLLLPSSFSSSGKLYGKICLENIKRNNVFPSMVNISNVMCAFFSYNIGKSNNSVFVPGTFHQGQL